MTYFLGAKEISEREKLLIRSLSDVELTMVMLGNVKIQASGLGKLTSTKKGGGKQKEKNNESKPKQQEKSKKNPKKK